MAIRTLNPVTDHEPWRLLVEEKPLRAEPFSEDHLAEHARELAGLLACSASSRSDNRFLKRFAQNAEYLRDSIWCDCRGGSWTASCTAPRMPNG